MPYGLILLLVLITLAGRYVLFTDVSPRLKVVVVGLVVLSFVWEYGIFVQLGLSLCLSVYFTYRLPSTSCTHSVVDYFHRQDKKQFTNLLSLVAPIRLSVAQGSGQTQA